METTLPQKPDALETLRNLRLGEIEQRLADLDAERAQLASLRRSIVAKERAKRRRLPPRRSEVGA